MRISIVVTVNLIEKPYINQFLEYYILHLKFKHAYLLITDKSDFSSCIKHEYRPRITYIHENRPLIKSFNDILPLINEDYFLILNVGDFLYLPKTSKYKTHHNLLEKCSQYAKISIQTTLCTTDKISHRNATDQLSKSDLLLGRYKKCFFKTSSMLEGVDYRNNDSHVAVQRQSATILSIVNRGLIYVLNKILYGKTKNRYNDVNRLLTENFTDFYNLPDEIKMLYIQKNLPKIDYNIDKFPKLKEKTDQKAELSLFENSYRGLLSEQCKCKLIYNVKKNFPIQNLVDLYPKYDLRYLLRETQNSQN